MATGWRTTILFSWGGQSTSELIGMIVAADNAAGQTVVGMVKSMEVVDGDVALTLVTMDQDAQGNAVEQTVSLSSATAINGDNASYLVGRTVTGAILNADGELTFDNDGSVSTVTGKVTGCRVTADEVIFLLGDDYELPLSALQRIT